MSYDHSAIEKKWRAYWEKNNTFYCDTHDFSKPKYYCLDMFPYPSGQGLHVVIDLQTGLVEIIGIDQSELTRMENDVAINITLIIGAVFRVIIRRCGFDFAPPFIDIAKTFFAFQDELKIQIILMPFDFGVLFFFSDIALTVQNDVIPIDRHFAIG